MVYYSKTRWLTLYTAHCFTDGGSIVAYLKEFVEALNEADCGDSPLDAPGDVLFNLAKDLARLKHGISPVFFDRINFKPTLATRMATQSLKLSLRLFPTLVPTLVDTVSQRSFFVDKWSRPFFRRKRFFESDHIISPDSPLINAAPLFVNIAPLDVESLVVDCRRHQVKLQTFVLFVYLHTIHQVCPDMYTDLFRRITVAVSLRNIYPQLSNHNTYLGNTGRFDDGFYTFLVNYYINPHTSCTWDAVRKYHAFLHRTIKGATWINEYYTMAHAMNADHYLDPKINVRKDDCFLMTTNLGLVDVIDHADSGLYHIEDILFSPSAGAMVGTHHLTMCSTAKSGLNVGFSDGDTNIKDWPTFCLKFKENLLALRDEM
ncbi:hypothetical protein JCM33374_g3356 [Metschnikowia sp. JCM 33374]|nr:hypothetical protein JCM33374_g3356 [Metschnikowia sp. JCM 33374]